MSGRKCRILADVDENLNQNNLQRQTEATADWPIFGGSIIIPPGGTATDPKVEIVYYVSRDGSKTLDDGASIKDKIAEFKQVIELDKTTPPEKPSSLRPAAVLIRATERRDATSTGPGSMITYAGEKHFSKTPLKNLKRIELASMSYRKQHKGRYLLLRIVSKPRKNVATVFVGQDPSGNATQVHVLCSPWALIAPGPELVATVPIGRVIMIKEPLFKLAEDGMPMVRVDSPTDIVFIDEQRNLGGLEWHRSVLRGDQLPPILTPDAYRAAGNELLAKGWLVPAERAYSDGIQADDDLNVALRLNRALVRVRYKVGITLLSELETTFGDGHKRSCRPSLWVPLQKMATFCFTLADQVADDTEAGVWLGRTVDWALGALLCVGFTGVSDQLAKAVVEPEHCISTLFLLAAAAKWVVRGDLQVPGGRPGSLRKLAKLRSGGGNTCQGLLRTALLIDQICISGAGKRGRALFALRYQHLLQRVGLSLADLPA